VERFFRERMIRNYDRCMAPLERRVFGEARDRLVPRASGRVLEIGVGTGANLARYTRAASYVAALDPEAGMLAAARARAEAARVGVGLVTASAEALPFPPECFDTVVGTLVFCTIGDPRRALAEAARVMRPGARLLLLEHVRSRNAVIAALQDFATPVQRVVAAGCHLNRRTRPLVERAGFSVSATRERFAGTVLELEATRAA
jgi:ubiquinone/menaquinone biosynthesis C-methylase UbiE